MKKIITFVILLPVLAGMLASCEKDNYDPPKTQFTGQLTYKGENFSFNGNTDVGEGSEIFQLYQDGYGKNGALNVRVNQEGHFSALLFDGEYTMRIKDQEYPFVWDEWPMQANGKPDSLNFFLNGNKHMEIKVTPYFEINNPVYTMGTSSINATFDIKEVLPGATAKKAYLYISTAVNVNKNTPLSQVVDIENIDKPVMLKVPLSKYRDSYKNNFRTYAYMRVAIETDKAAEFLWSPVYKLEDIPLSLNEEDVTALYLKNAGPGFKTIPGSVAKGSSDAKEGLKATPADWTVNDAVKIYDGWGGIDQRWDRDRLCVVNWDVCDEQLILNGKIYQTTTLPAGRYTLSVKIGESAGGADRCYMVIHKGPGAMPDWQDKQTAFAYTDVTKDNTLEFELTEETTLTIGFLYNFPTYGQQCAFGFDSIKLVQGK